MRAVRGLVEFYLGGSFAVNEITSVSKRDTRVATRVAPSLPPEPPSFLLLGDVSNNPLSAGTLVVGAARQGKENPSRGGSQTPRRGGGDDAAVVAGTASGVCN